MTPKEYSQATGMSYLTCLRNIKKGKIKATKKRIAEIDIPESEIEVGKAIMERWKTKAWLRKRPVETTTQVIQ